MFIAPLHSGIGQGHLICFLLPACGGGDDVTCTSSGTGYYFCEVDFASVSISSKIGLSIA